MHLAVTISSHGYGHGAQTATVLAALRARLPALRLTLLTGLPRTFFTERIGDDFTLIDWRTDFGMHMSSALDVDRSRSADAYAALHAHWPAQVDAACARLEAVAPDLLLANVPYLPLAAAARLGLPALALCSLNWAGIYRHYFSTRPEAPAVLAAMQAAYASARHFLCPAPSMAMPELGNVRSIGPLAQLGQPRREQLRERLGSAGQRRLVMIAHGGIPLRLPLQAWPVDPDITWIVPQAWGIERPDMHAFEALGLSFVDTLASVDALLGKLGYGTVTECACNGIPLLYTSRPDWPEEACLAAWLERHGRCAAVPREALETGRLRAALEGLWAQPVPPLPVPTGAEEAARFLNEFFEPPGNLGEPPRRQGCQDV
ncbi:MAG: hypothetical protein WCY26_08985 [Thiohalobacteraceae bacterium]|nr:hypothetical protein [Gammaproteobacteria bacterium]